MPIEDDYYRRTKEPIYNHIIQVEYYLDVLLMAYQSTIEFLIIIEELRD